MRVIDRFLKEDLLVTRPSMFIYISKDIKDPNSIDGIRLDSSGKVNAYLTRLPEDGSYKEFLDSHYPVRITLSKLRKIKNQLVKLNPKNLDGAEKLDLKDDSTLDKLIKKYRSYLDTCYKDHIPLEDLPHIEMYFSSGVIPGFSCKVLEV